MTRTVEKDCARRRYCNCKHAVNYTSRRRRGSFSCIPANDTKCITEQKTFLHGQEEVLGHGSGKTSILQQSSYFCERQSMRIDLVLFDQHLRATEVAVYQAKLHPNKFKN